MDELRKYCEKGRDEIREDLARRADEGTIGEYSYGYAVGYQAALTDVLRKLPPSVEWNGEVSPVETA